MSLGRILREKREQMNLTLDEVSFRSGFSKPYLSTVETGKVKNPPSDELLKKLERILEFQPGTLLHMAHMERMPADIREQYESAEAENQRLRRVIKDILEGKSDSARLDGLLAETGSGIGRGTGTLSPGRLVPVINKVSAGYPTDFDDLDYPVGVAEDYVRCPDLHDTNAFAVRVVGDSMEPKYREGDVVIFSPAAEVNSGDDCFVRFESPHETTFKRVFFEGDDNVRLQPRNEKYPPMIVPGERINGVYRAVVRYERL
jgi:repressor LexA